MNPIAAYLINQELLRLVQQRQAIGMLSAKSETREPSSVLFPGPSGSGTGVYFNNKEVPQEMHFPCTGRKTSSGPKLPTGKPMPQPPRLMMSSTPSFGPHANGQASKHFEIGDKRESSSEPCDSREAKRTKTQPPKDPLTSDQEAFIEAALALASVKNDSGQESPSEITPCHSPKSVLRAALPPPPFSLSKRKHVGKLRALKAAKTA